MGTDTPPARDMPTALPGLPLPMELVLEIIKHIHDEKNWYPYHPGSETESVDPVIGLEDEEYDNCFDVSNGCKIIDEQAKTEIANIRLVCKQLRVASVEPFVRILTHRRFRLTKAGVEDLKGIGAVDELATRIGQLTFGTAQLHSNLGRPSTAYGILAEDLRRNNAEFVRQIEAIDKQFCESEPYPHDIAKKELVQAVRAFRNLKHLRIIGFDKATHLAGWLTPEQSNFVQAQEIENSKDSRVPTVQSYWGYPSFYTPWNPDIATIIMKAFEEAELPIRTLKCGVGVPVEPFRCFRFDTLRELDVVIEPRLIMVSEGNDSGDTLFESFRNLKNLQTLALEMRDYNERDRYDWYTREDEHRTTEVLRAVKTMTSLRSFTLTGAWDFSKEALLDFFKTHPSSLHHVELCDGVLSNDWLEVLDTLTSLAHEKLYSLTIAWPRRAYVGWLVGPQDLFGYSPVGWPQYSCIEHDGYWLLSMCNWAEQSSDESNAEN